MAENKMREITVDKVTLNIGVGEAGQKLENARSLLNRITGRKPVTTVARVRSPTWKLKQGDQIGTKVTLRGKEALALLKRALEAVDFSVNGRSFDRKGNFAFGVHEYIDFPGVKYDPKIGILGFDVCVTLKRRGDRVLRRRRAPARRIAPGHGITADEAREFATGALGVKIAEAAE
jgi:large subunit ribosomal protein L5